MHTTNNYIMNYPVKEFYLLNHSGFGWVETDTIYSTQTSVW